MNTFMNKDKSKIKLFAHRRLFTIKLIYEKK